MASGGEDYESGMGCHLIMETFYMGDGYLSVWVGFNMVILCCWLGWGDISLMSDDAKIACIMNIWNLVLSLVQIMTYCCFWWGEQAIPIHWGRVTHICVSKVTNIGSNNGLLPGRHQAIIWINAIILLIGCLGTNFSEHLIEIYTSSFKKIHLKMLSAKWRPFCLSLNLLSLSCMHNNLQHWVIIGSSNDMKLVKCQAITWTNVDILSWKGKENGWKVILRHAMDIGRNL